MSQRTASPHAIASALAHPYDLAMRWLIHGDVQTAAVEALRRHGHRVTTPEEIELPPDAQAADVLKNAHKRQLDVVTTSPQLAAAAIGTPVRFDRSLVFLQLEGGAVEQDDAIARMFHRYKRLTPGRMYTVTATRVKVRQLPRG
jgi:hypothetical protein